MFEIIHHTTHAVHKLTTSMTFELMKVHTSSCIKLNGLKVLLIVDISILYY